MPSKRLLVVSHACVTPVNQLLFCELEAAYPDMEITVLTPSNWRNDFTGTSWKVEAHACLKGRLATLPVLFPWHISLHVYQKGLKQLLEEINPDWIYLDEEPWALVTQQVARLTRALGPEKRRVPFVFHTNQNLQKRYPWPFCQFEQWIYREAAHALPVGEEAAQVLRRKGYENPLTIFPYGIDETLYRPEHKLGQRFRALSNTANERFVFAYFGRLVEEKGPSLLLKAFQPISQDYPQATLWLVGGGPEEMRLSHLANSLGLREPAFQMLPSVPHLEAPAVYNAIDVLVLPSLTRPFWKEQFGRVIIEALACGKPVIGSDSGEIPYLIQKLGGGLIAEEGNTGQWTAAMRQLIEDRTRGQILAGTGRERVLAGYTNAQLAQVFAHVFYGLESHTQTAVKV